MDLSAYPRPKNDTGIGFHWFPTELHFGDKDLAIFLPELAKLQASWLVLMTPAEILVPESFIKGLLERNIEPVIYLCASPIASIDSDRLKDVVKAYAKWGCHYLQVYNEPNSKKEWKNWKAVGLAERFMDIYLPVLEILHRQDRIIPVFTSLSPAGDYDDQDLLKRCLEIINAKKASHLYEKMAVGLHNFCFNKPIDWGKGGSAAWPQTKPYRTPADSQDHAGFRLFEWCDEIVQKYVEHSLPMIATRNGPRLGDHQHPGYPTTDYSIHAELSFHMSRALMFNEVPDYVFNNAFWLLSADDDDPQQKYRWYRPNGDPVHKDSIVILTGMSKRLRRIPSVSDKSIRVLMPDGHIETLPLEEYLRGVVPTEIGASAPVEAIKAQAVAARSYAIAAIRNPRHPGADVCTTTHCQAWRPKNHAVTDKAIRQTAGIVALYKGELATTYFFGHCNGHTHNSEDVWQKALPYCRSVSCVCGYTEYYGHGVGMCQRGAMEMARRGADYEAILKHYYTGITLSVGAPAPEPLEPSPVAISRWSMRLRRQAGELKIIGRLPYSGIRLVIADQWGNAVPVTSGTKTEYGVGGFEQVIWHNGVYTISFLNEEFHVDINNETVEVDFVETGKAGQDKEQPSSGKAVVEPETSPIPSQPLEAPVTSPAPIPAEPGEEMDLPAIPADDAPEAREGEAPAENPADEGAGLPQPAPATQVPPPSAGQEQKKKTKSPQWDISLEYRPGVRGIAGAMPYPAVQLEFIDPWDNSITTVSGSKPEYGQGGFEVPAWTDGDFRLCFQDEEFIIPVRGNLVFLRLTPKSQPPASARQGGRE